MPRKKTSVEAAEDLTQLRVVQETLETIDQEEELTQENVIPFVPQDVPVNPDYISPYEQAVNAIAEKINKPVPDSLILKREGGGGKFFDYIQGQDAIRIANDLFGWNNWSSSVEELRVEQPTPEAKPVWIARVRVSAFGAFHDGIGFAAPQGNPAHDQVTETAIKGAETDALKRALRYFGEALGNSLYPDAETKAADDAARQQARSVYNKPASANPNPPAAKAPPAQAGVICEDCGSPVTTFGSLTMEQLINIRQKKFGAIICSSCTRKPEWVAKAKERTAS